MKRDDIEKLEVCTNHKFIENFSRCTGKVFNQVLCFTESSTIISYFKFRYLLKKNALGISSNVPERPIVRE